MILRHSQMMGWTQSGGSLGCGARGNTQLMAKTRPPSTPLGSGGGGQDCPHDVGGWDADRIVRATLGDGRGNE